MTEVAIDKASTNIKYCRCCGKLKKIICNKCGKNKKPEEYHAGKKICKDCRSDYNKDRYQKKKQKQQKSEESPIFATGKLVIDS